MSDKLQFDDLEIDGDDAMIVETPQPLPQLALAEVLPKDFPLRTLLTFLPDVRLKQRLVAAADTALTIKVEGESGLKSADAALVELRAMSSEIESCFHEVKGLAFQLHRRLTGLESDFLQRGKEAIDRLGRAIYNERRRLDEVAKQEQQRLQREADERAREVARQAAEDAARRNAPAEVVDRLERQVETAKAAPVQVQGAPALSGSTTVENWKARLRGTPDGEDPNPATADIPKAQLEQFDKVVASVARGELPRAAVQLNWSYLNAQAKAEKSTLSIPGIESFDQGSTRAKPRRR